VPLEVPKIGRKRRLQQRLSFMEILTVSAEKHRGWLIVRVEVPEVER
jgi:hypothetical protein